MDNAAAFIDGFNLYHGMVDSGLRPWLWLDLWELARAVTPKRVHLNEVNYYSAPSRTGYGSNERQGDFISAQKELHPEINVELGFFRPVTKHCDGCAPGHKKWVEKRSDVNMSVEAMKALLAGTEPRFDVAVFITADSDQVATVEAIKAEGLGVVVAFPPGRYSDHLRDAADRALKIGRDHIVGSQMKHAIALTGKNKVVERPEQWGPVPDVWPDYEAVDFEDDY